MASSLTLLLVAGGGCSKMGGDDVALQTCRDWHRRIGSTLRDPPSLQANTAEMRGHCTGAEDHIISMCSRLATDEEHEAELVEISEAYEEACRAGRKRGIRDPSLPEQERAAAWKQTLTDVSSAFESMLASIDASV